MQNYKDKSGQVHVLDDEAFEHLLPAGCVKISDKEAAKLQLPPEPTAAEVLAQGRADAQAYLDKSDWYFARKAETGEAVPVDVLEKRAASRALLNEVV